MSASATAAEIVLVFDVETTGIIRQNTAPVDWPHMTQLSFLLYDHAAGVILERYNNYIQLPAGVEVPPVVVELTGITRAVCDAHGVPPAAALAAFAEAYKKCHVVVAHNMEFDSLMIAAEFARLGQDVPSPTQGQRLFCTMRATTRMCNIRITRPNGSSFVKFPKLVELFRTLFPYDEPPANFHDSAVDTAVTLRCYVKLVHKEDIYLNPFSGYAEILPRRSARLAARAAVALASVDTMAPAA